MPIQIVQIPTSQNITFDGNNAAIAPTEISDVNNQGKVLYNNGGTLEYGANGANEPLILDGSALVPQGNLPSYVDDIVNVATFSALPVTGESGKIYITTNTNEIWRWNSGTSQYFEIADLSGFYNKTESDARFLNSDGDVLLSGNLDINSGSILRGSSINTDLVKTKDGVTTVLDTSGASMTVGKSIDMQTNSVSNASNVECSGHTRSATIQNTSGENVLTLGATVRCEKDFNMNTNSITNAAQVTSSHFRSSNYMSLDDVAPVNIPNSDLDLNSNDILNVGDANCAVLRTNNINDANDVPYMQFDGTSNNCKKPLVFNDGTASNRRLENVDRITVYDLHNTVDGTQNLHFGTGSTDLVKPLSCAGNDITNCGTIATGAVNTDTLRSAGAVNKISMSGSDVDMLVPLHMGNRIIDEISTGTMSTLQTDNIQAGNGSGGDKIRLSGSDIDVYKNLHMTNNHIYNVNQIHVDTIHQRTTANGPLTLGSTSYWATNGELDCGRRSLTNIDHITSGSGAGNKEQCMSFAGGHCEMFRPFQCNNPDLGILMQGNGDILFNSGSTSNLNMNTRPILNAGNIACTTVNGHKSIKYQQNSFTLNASGTQLITLNLPASSDIWSVQVLIESVTNQWTIYRGNGNNEVLNYSGSPGTWSHTFNCNGENVIVRFQYTD